MSQELSQLEERDIQGVTGMESIMVMVEVRLVSIGAVHKLRHPIRGYGGVSQKMTKDDRGEGGGLAKDDR